MITIGIAISSPLLKAGIKALFSLSNNYETGFETSDGEELLQLLFLTKMLPDILIVDTHLRKLKGETILIESKKMFPQLRIIMLSSIEEMNFIIHLFNRGANAFIKVSDEPDFFISTINKVHENEYFYNKYPVPKIRPSEKDWNRYGFIGEVTLSHREI